MATHKEIMEYMAESFDISNPISRQVIKDTVDFIKEHDISKEDFDSIDYCENNGCDNMELDDNLVHSIYYDNKRVCPECIGSI
jgi:hypothetical protein